MLKSSERNSANAKVGNPCFEKGEHSPEFGISFEKKDGTKRFAPLSFLSAVDFHGPDELVFRYTFGTVAIRGRKLEAIWDILRQGSLVRLCEAGDISSGEPSIETITVTDFAEDSHAEPRFPVEHSPDESGAPATQGLQT